MPPAPSGSSRRGVEHASTSDSRPACATAPAGCGTTAVCTRSKSKVGRKWTSRRAAPAIPSPDDRVPAEWRRSADTARGVTLQRRHRADTCSCRGPAIPPRTPRRQPLHYHVGDREPGQTLGQHVEDSLGEWSLMSAAGAKVRDAGDRRERDRSGSAATQPIHSTGHFRVWLHL